MADDNRRWLGDSLQKYRKYQREFAERTYTSVSLRLKKRIDSDVIAVLASLKNRTDYIRRLVRADISGARIVDEMERKEVITDEAGRVWVVDKPAYSEIVKHEEVGHWEEPEA